MHSVLGDLALGHALEVEPWLATTWVMTRRDLTECGTTVDHDSVVGRHATAGNQLVDQCRMVLHGRAEHLRPESCLCVRIGTVERHLCPQRQHHAKGRSPAAMHLLGCWCRPRASGGWGLRLYDPDTASGGQGGPPWTAATPGCHAPQIG